MSYQPPSYQGPAYQPSYQPPLYQPPSYQRSPFKPTAYPVSYELPMAAGQLAPRAGGSPQFQASPFYPKAPVSPYNPYGGGELQRTPVNMPACRPTPDSNSKIIRILSLYYDPHTFGRDVAINSFYEVFQGYAKYIQEPDLDQAVIPDGFKRSDNHSLTPSQKLDKMITNYTSACKGHMFKSPWCTFIKRQIKAHAQILIAGLQEKKRAAPGGKLPPAAEILLVGLLTILYVGVGCLLIGAFLAAGVEPPEPPMFAAGGDMSGGSRKRLKKRNKSSRKGRRVIANTRKRSGTAKCRS